MGKLLAHDQVIERFRNAHGDKYNYDLVSYKNKDAKVKIICKYHGAFEQSPSAHFKGHGCLKCSAKHEKRSQSCAILDLSKKHGKRFDYSSVVYKSSHKKIEIICRQHGSFSMTYANHLQGQSCPKCSIITKSRRQRSSIEQVKVAFHSVHGDRYNYHFGGKSKIRAKDNVKIECHRHGLFYQSVDSHKKGSGCRLCANESLVGLYSYKNLSKTGLGQELGYFYIAFIRSKSGEFAKIGITRKNNPISRLSGVGAGNMVFRFFTIKTNLLTAFEIEQRVLLCLDNLGKRFRVHNLRNQSSKGWTECFHIEDSGIVYNNIKEFFGA